MKKRDKYRIWDYVLIKSTSFLKLDSSMLDHFKLYFHEPLFSTLTEFSCFYNHSSVWGRVILITLVSTIFILLDDVNPLQ